MVWKALIHDCAEVGGGGGSGFAQEEQASGIARAMDW